MYNRQLAFKACSSKLRKLQRRRKEYHQIDNLNMQRVEIKYEREKQIVMNNASNSN
jgi:hypothetical protein